VCRFVEEISVQNGENNKTVTASTDIAGKKPYAPPKLTSIKLRPEEAVLGNCKLAGGHGPSEAAPPNDLCNLCGITLGT